ncbi:heat shock protein 90-6, mitochondrial [Artemisia annua]|uniref:Heat shock protein 90-6, mitochondrial n=1 Tax=Artemisia annua TaxID=35608 RepID=A0A2U1KXN7_ARTAN|nr:heat shock protein 90-6, mitochondrial [Artemisia annua]
MDKSVFRVEVDEDPAEAKKDGTDDNVEKKKKTKKVIEKYWDWELTNETQPIWLWNPKEVTTQEYNEFYRKAFNEYLDPLASSNFTTEVVTNIGGPFLGLPKIVAGLFSAEAKDIVVGRLKETMDRLAAKLEAIYTASGKKKINVIIHSMGGLLVKCFMSRHNDIFEKYVNSWIAIAAPFQDKLLN